MNFGFNESPKPTECMGCHKIFNTTVTECDKCFGVAFQIIPTSYDDVKDKSPLELNKRVSFFTKAVASDPDNQTLNTAIAFCYFKLKLYDKALPYFEKAIEDNFDNSETYFYAAITLLKGKKPFLTPRAVIDKIEEYIQAAIMVEPKAIYHYFWAYVRHDHHFRKSYRMSPNYQELFNQAKQLGLTLKDVNELFSVLGTERPSVL